MMGMGSLSLFLAAAVVVVAGFGWTQHWFDRWFHQPPTDQASMQQALKDQGALKQNGQVSTGTEFDSELNAQLKELNAADTDSTTQLDSLQQQP